MSFRITITGQQPELTKMFEVAQRKETRRLERIAAHKAAERERIKAAVEAATKPPVGARTVTERAAQRDLFNRDRDREGDKS